MSFPNPLNRIKNYFEQKQVRYEEPQEIEVGLTMYGGGKLFTKRIREGSTWNGLRSKMTITKIEDPKKVINILIQNPGVPTAGDIFYMNSFGKCRIESINSIDFGEEIESLNREALEDELEKIYSKLNLLIINLESYENATGAMVSADGAKEILTEKKKIKDQIPDLENRFLRINMKLSMIKAEDESSNENK